MKAWLNLLNGRPSRTMVSRLCARSPTIRFGLAAVLFLVALVIPLSFYPLGTSFPFLTFYPAVALSALFFGFGPGVMATLLGAAGALILLPAPLEGQAGQILPVLIFVLAGFIVSGLAFSARRQAIELVAAEQRFHDVAESSADWFWETDREGRFTYVSDNYASLVGAEPSALLGVVPKSLAEAIAAVDRKSPQNSLRDCLFAVGDSGQEFVLNGVPFRDTDGAFAGYRGTARRVTPLVHVEIEQQRLTRALRLLTEGVSAVVHARDEAELLRDICQRIVSTGGYPLAWIGFARPDEQSTLVPVASCGDEDGYLDSVRISWAAGSPYSKGPAGQAVLTGAPCVVDDFMASPDFDIWRDAISRSGYRSAVGLPLSFGGLVIGVLLIYARTPRAFSCEDVALLGELARNLSFGLQSLHAKQDLDLHRRNLEQLVAERTEQISNLNRQLAERADEAEAANRAKSDFLATMSHEIRTPINAVVGLTELLTETTLSRRQWDCVNKIQLLAESLRALIDDILDFSKIEAGALTIEQAPFSLNKILRALAAIVSIGVRGKPIEIIFDVPHDIPDMLVGDSLRLQQILLNLTNNAVKFTNAGEIVIAIRQSASKADETGVTLNFSVRDTGIGIPADKLEHIFDVFTQADSSISRTHGGSGLGLAICARLAELMGGVVEVESTPGQGSEFRLSLALRKEESSAQVSEEQAAGEMSLLIVDDHPLVRANLLQACDGFGWQAKAVDSGPAALEELARSAAEGRDYDILLLDWRMPDMDGLQMLREARRTPGIGLPLVVLMASASEVAEAIAAGDDEYLDGVLAKPIWPASLQEAVRNAWSGEFPELQTSPVRHDRRLAGLRLLVAEDNDINRELIEGILVRAGAEVVLAVNGQAAVEALKAEPHFDGVLMDVQMPVMDGFAATRVIREELGLRDLPIVAVTAHAGAADLERSRSAGMNGLVLKPLQVDDLLDFIAGDGRMRDLRSTGKNAENAYPLLDLPGLEPNALDRFGGDAAYYGEILRQFASRHGGEAAEVKTLFERGDFAGATRMVHQLGGVAAFLRATELPVLTTRIEKILAGPAPRSAAPLLTELADAMETLLTSIARFDSENAGGM
jgi:PAS domain S-box-containing protein